MTMALVPEAQIPRPILKQETFLECSTIEDDGNWKQLKKNSATMGKGRASTECVTLETFHKECLPLE
jgi:hypothetical protein